MPCAVWISSFPLRFFLKEFFSKFNKIHDIYQRIWTLVSFEDEITKKFYFMCMIFYCYKLYFKALQSNIKVYPMSFTKLENLSNFVVLILLLRAWASEPLMW